MQLILCAIYRDTVLSPDVCFHCRCPTITYMKPIIFYGASVWNPMWKGKIKQLEKIQHKFTKKLSGLGHFSYIKRLHKLKALSLEHERRKADLILIYICLHNLNDISGVELACSAGMYIFRNCSMINSNLIIITNRAYAWATTTCFSLSWTSAIISLVK